MIHHVFEKTWNWDENKSQKVWDKLQLRETFTAGQLPPYKVEFESGLTSGRMQPQELNIHHGPLLSVHGAVGEMNDKYRDLNYSYGSYVLSYRLIRPTRLEFNRTKVGLQVRLVSQVHPLIKPLWNFGLEVFWTFFGYSI